jgi:hypothetical protein
MNMVGLYWCLEPTDEQADLGISAPAERDGVNMHAIHACCHPTFGRGGSYQCMGKAAIEFASYPEAGERGIGEQHQALARTADWAVFRPATCSFSRRRTSSKRPRVRRGVQFWSDGRGNPAIEPGRSSTRQATCSIRP